MHLVEKLYIYGPVHIRWMYPMERYLKTLNGYVQSRANPEANIAQGYVIDEVFGFCTAYMQISLITNPRVWHDREDPTRNDEILEGVGRPKILMFELRDWIHKFMVNNMAFQKSWRE